MANSLSSQVEKILTASLGDFIAKATLKKNCSLINVSPEELKPEHMNDLASHIEKSVAFFSDSTIAAEIADKIKALGS